MKQQYDLSPLFLEQSCYLYELAKRYELSWLTAVHRSSAFYYDVFGLITARLNWVSMGEL